MLALFGCKKLLEYVFKVHEIIIIELVKIATTIKEWVSQIA